MPQTVEEIIGDIESKDRDTRIRAAVDMLNLDLPISCTLTGEVLSRLKKDVLHSDIAVSEVLRLSHDYKNQTKRGLLSELIKKGNKKVAPEALEAALGIPKTELYYTTHDYILKEACREGRKDAYQKAFEIILTYEPLDRIRIFIEFYKLPISLKLWKSDARRTITLKSRATHHLKETYQEVLKQEEGKEKAQNLSLLSWMFYGADDELMKMKPEISLEHLNYRDKKVMGWAEKHYTEIHKLASQPFNLDKRWQQIIAKSFVREIAISATDRFLRRQSFDYLYSEITNAKNPTIYCSELDDMAIIAERAEEPEKGKAFELVVRLYNKDYLRGQPYNLRYLFVVRHGSEEIFRKAVDDLFEVYPDKEQHSSSRILGNDFPELIHSLPQDRADYILQRIESPKWKKAWEERMDSKNEYLKFLENIKEHLQEPYGSRVQSMIENEKAPKPVPNIPEPTTLQQKILVSLKQSYS